ncbi:MAG: LPS export ABC transporter permease LptG [Candidatus Sedimenticola endophacoides]
MRLLDRYIARTVLSSILVALLVLLVLVGFMTLMDELDAAGKGNYHATDAFLYVLLVLPRRAYEVFPMAVLLGSLVGLGGMAGSSELVAIRAAGVSLGRIILSVMRAGVIFMVAVLLVGEFVAPKTEQYAERMRAEKVSQQVTLKTKYGFWARDGRSFVNIRKILPGSQLKDIYIYEYDDARRLKVATHAAFAQYAEDHWLMKDISQSVFHGEEVERRKIDSAIWASMLNPSLLDVVVVRPTMLPLWGLYDYINFMHENGQEAVIYEVAFWMKLITPLVTLVMVFLAVPFVFGTLRSVGIGQRIFLGTMLGLGFFLLSQMFSSMAVVFSLPPLLAASLPAIVFLGLGIYFVRRIH